MSSFSVIPLLFWSGSCCNLIFETQKSLSHHLYVKIPAREHPPPTVSQQPPPPPFHPFRVRFQEFFPVFSSFSTLVAITYHSQMPEGYYHIQHLFLSLSGGFNGKAYGVNNLENFFFPFPWQKLKFNIFRKGKIERKQKQKMFYRSVEKFYQIWNVILLKLTLSKMYSFRMKWQRVKWKNTFPVFQFSTNRESRTLKSTSFLSAFFLLPLFLFLKAGTEHGRLWHPDSALNWWTPTRRFIYVTKS